MQAEQQFLTLREVGQALITTFDVPELMTILARELPCAGIPGCYLALYEHPHAPTECAKLMLAYHGENRVTLPADGQRFPATQLIPPGMWPEYARFTLLLEALYFREEQIGFVLFEVGPEDIVTRMTQMVATSNENPLRVEISSALQGALLVERVQSHTEELRQYRDHLEDLVQSRTTELARSNALLHAEVLERQRAETELTRSNARLHEEILERNRAEQAVRVSEQQYRLLAENTMDGILIVQSDKVIFANKVFALMTGYAAEYLALLDPLALFRPADRQTLHIWLTQDISVTSEPAFQVELLTKDQHAIWAELSQTAIVWNSQPASLLAIRDITDRKLREQRLEEERARLQQENLSLKSTIKERYRFGQLVGKSPAMQRVYELIINAASSDVNVLIVGESGTGKELIAQTLHQVSRRKAQAFVPVNCASIPETLFEREFFGHRKGAFTGADRDTPRLFDHAHQDTLFLDEVTELSPATQAKLLRVLQDGVYTPLGGNTPKHADVLIVAATNKDCRQEIAQGRLRKDFFYRIGVIELTVPPLRERKEDVPLLIEYILAQYRQKQAEVHGSAPSDLPTDQTMLPGELVQVLYAYDWPGNVRELQNVLQRYVATRNLNAVLPSLGISARFRSHSAAELPPADLPLPDAVADLEKRMIAETLARTKHHIGKTSALLKIPRRTLQRKIKAYDL